MNKIINTVFIALAAMIVMGTADAKRLEPKRIPVTQNEKKMFIDAKNLQNSKTPAAKEKAAEKLAHDLKKDPFTFLLLEREELTEEISRLEDKIAKESGYISYFDTKEIQDDKLKLTELQEDLAEVQNEINEIKGIQSPAISTFKTKAFYTTLGIIGIGLLDQIITGGAGRTAILNKAGAIGEYFYPSVPSATPTEGSNSLLGAAGGLAAGWAANKVKAYAQAALEQKAFDTLMSYIEDPDVDPSAKEDYIQQAKAQEMQLEQTKKKIANMELEEQIAQQRNLKPETK